MVELHSQVILCAHYISYLDSSRTYRFKGNQGSYKVGGFEAQNDSLEEPTMPENDYNASMDGDNYSGTSSDPARNERIYGPNGLR